MNEFWTAALPWIVMGLAIAIWAVNCMRAKAEDSEEKKSEHKRRVSIGIGIGILLGVAFNIVGIFENHALGISLGMLWGMVIGNSIKTKS